MPQFRKTFTTPYEQLSDREGQPFTVLGEVPHEEYDFDECGVMYVIQFEDGTKAEAWPEEVEET